LDEIELKFLIDAAEARLIWSRLKASGLPCTPRRVRSLHSIYHDTGGGALREAGISLRLRRAGRRWVQTVKIGARHHQGLSRTDEVECAVPGGRLNLSAIPDATVREAILRRLQDQPLQVVGETVIRRISCIVSLPGGTRVELATDAGRIIAGERSAELREAEIELLEGSAVQLFALARIILPRGGLRFSRLSKVARAELLGSEGYIEPPLAPVFSSRIAVDPGQNAEGAARVMMGECLDHLAANTVVVRALDDVEGPHQLRVGLRRLRSVFLLFRPILACPELERLEDEARWLGAEVGRLRDLDVLGRDVVGRQMKADPDEKSLRVLADVLDRMAQAERKALRRTLASARTQEFLIDLACFIETRGWLVSQDLSQTSRLAVPLRHFASGAIEARWRKVLRRGRHLESLDIGQRHALRKELKKLRYATEFLAPVFPGGQAERLGARLRALQNVFGALNDLALAEARLQDPTLPALRGPQVQRAVGLVLGSGRVRADQAWLRARALWRDFRSSHPYWK
jgi:triphosphatase